MGLIRKITQETNYRFLNFFKFDVTHKNGRESEYYVSSRAKSSDGLKAVTGKNKADGVVIYAICKGEPEKVVLIRQYRYPIGGYVYEFPAGLVEAGEDFNTSAVRELEEETGLTFLPIAADTMYQEPRFTTVGMTDESCATVYGYAEGMPSILGQEESEEIEIVLADKEEARRILKEERVALMCAYMLMRFIHEEDGRHFDFLKEE